MSGNSFSGSFHQARVRSRSIAGWPLERDTQEVRTRPLEIHARDLERFDQPLRLGACYFDRDLVSNHPVNRRPVGVELRLLPVASSSSGDVEEFEQVALKAG